MTTTDSVYSLRTGAPIDAVVERLNDPTVAASLVALLDNAELLSTLVHGLGGMVERSDAIMNVVAEGIHEMASLRPNVPAGMPTFTEAAAMMNQLAAVAPTLTRVLDSSMVQPATIDLLDMMSEAATEGAARAQANGTRVKGARGALRAMKDPDVQRGMGLLIEIAGALGRRMNEPAS